MNEQGYKDRLNAFRDSCRVYNQEKQVLDSVDKNSDPMLIQFIRENVEHVEYILSLTKEICGSSIALMIWMLFVEQKTQAAVAYQMNITRRQLQYSLHKHMRLVFEEEQNRAGR